MGIGPASTSGLDEGEIVPTSGAECHRTGALGCRPGSRFRSLPGLAAADGGDEDHVAGAVARARSASAGFADWLETVYLPQGQALRRGRSDRYTAESEVPRAASRLDETYDWGWSEVHRLLGEMKDTAAEIDPDLNIDEVIDLLDNDPGRSAPDHDAFADFVREIQAHAVERLDGSAFDVPPPMCDVTVNLAPRGALGAWYVAPSEDLERPGSIWYALGERTRIPYWQEVATAYHEGFPGHHLQVGLAVLQREKLSRFHRLFVWYPGSGEGWALYAERLMEELGFFENPEYRLGLHASQLFRSTRVVVDIGAHLEKRIPDDAPLHPGEVWNYELAVDYMEKIGRQPRDVAESEVLRYLGWPGQAISYKVGEREILNIRKQAMTEAGASFDRQGFSPTALGGWSDQARSTPRGDDLIEGSRASAAVRNERRVRVDRSPFPYIPKWRWGFVPTALPEVPRTR